MTTQLHGVMHDIHISFHVGCCSPVEPVLRVYLVECTLYSPLVMFLSSPILCLDSSSQSSSSVARVETDGGKDGGIQS